MLSRNSAPEQAWKRCGENLGKYKPSGTYYVRVRVAGKLHVKSRETPLLTVARQRLNDEFRDDLFEDLDFARRMRREGRVVTLRPPIISSARRFQGDGAIRKTLSDLWLTFRYSSGVHPNQLARELNGRLWPLPPAARSQPDAPYRRASPTLHCKDEPYPSVGRRGLTDDSHLPSERSSLQDL